MQNSNYRLIFRLVGLMAFVLIFALCSEDEPEDIIIIDELPMDSIPNPGVDPNPIVDYNLWEIKNGKFYLDGEWVFLKIGKPLRDFSSLSHVDRLIADLDRLRSKYYNTIELNCYWHHFDTDGDGIPDKSLAPLSKLVDAIYEKGMYPCLSVETYSVGGGQIPAGFWSIYPDAYAIDNNGNKVNDTEYGFGTNVVSIFHSGYRENVHTFIKSLAEGIDTKKILYFETTVEPQYMGTIDLCYSENARAEYLIWRNENNITDVESEMPEIFPIGSDFVENETWNIFRAQFLAKWINDDAAAYREVAGEDAYVATDYLDAAEADQQSRVGNPAEFLSHLTAPNIIQLNWTWYTPTNSVNQKAYDRVWEAKNSDNRDWAISEHMTFNGSDFSTYGNQYLELILENTLKQGTRFGWEFVNISNNSSDSFSLYNSDWSPKRVISFVDEHWGYWLYRAGIIEGSD